MPETRKEWLNFSLSFALIALAVTSLKAAESTDHKSLQGDWIPVKAELSGKPIPEAVLKKIHLKLGSGTYDATADGEPDKGTFEIDPNASPKGMVIKGTDGPNKGKVIPAIYEVQGKTLRICYDLSGTQRPKDFKSLPGTKLYLVRYERQK